MAQPPSQDRRPSRGRSRASASTSSRSPDSGPPIVAELGRPETPAETAARRAENSRKHRANQTVVNLVLALVASLGIVLLLVLVVVRPDPPADDPVDVQVVASQAQPGIETTLVVPALPPGWSSNRAELESGPGDGVTWSVGLITPAPEYIGLEQGIGVPSDFVERLVGEFPATGETTIDGVEWDVYDRRESADVGNFAYSLVTTIDDAVFVLHGSAADDEFTVLASAVVASATAGAPR